jgi:hypothetical protein
MTRTDRPSIARILAPIFALGIILVMCASQSSAAQVASDLPPLGHDSVTIVAGPDYAAGSFHRQLLGDNYRDVWATRIRVPILDLKTFAGGLKPGKLGGGQQTRSIRLIAPDSSEWVFRSVLKVGRVLSKQFDHTVVAYIFADYGSASHPTGAIAADRLQDIAGVLHPNPRLAVMPDDPILGKNRKEFAGMLGEIEQYPTVPKNGSAFADVSDIIDSDKLLDKMNKDPRELVDSRNMLSAVLLDLFMGDNDRHPGQWKWARTGKKGTALWEPIARDRDKVFVSYGGLIGSLARIGLHSLVSFNGAYPEPTALFANGVDFDRRVLSNLDKATWDSVANALTAGLSDAEIDRAIATLPPQYAPTSLRIDATLRERRNNLRAEADHYYDILSRVVDVHGTDADDQATIHRNADGSVDVQLASQKSGTYYSRRFQPAETQEIRVYLHDGDDRAVITGAAANSIHLRVIGGNGKNTLTDSSVVGGDRHPTHFLDEGDVSGVSYAVDSVAEKLNADDALNHRFDRLPWLHHYGKLIPPQRDYGVSISPTGKINSGRGLGYVPRIGFSRYTYGFRDVPYSNLFKMDAGYSLGHGGVSINVLDDKRFEDTDAHVPVTAQYSQLELVEFRGFGNNVPDSRSQFYNVRQTQRNFRPAVGFSFNPLSDISLGPIVRYTTTDSIANRFISQLNPYGAGNFGQAGLQLRAHYETRYVPDTLKPRGVFELNGTSYPSAWDVKSAYSSIDGFAAAFFTIPVAKKPVLALRAGGKKLFGDFPYFDAAFLGGSSSLRAEERQQYAGDESIYGNSEIRLPVAQFPFILPLDVGLIGFADAGRVYVNGDSPGGWHSALGGGFWVGFLNPGMNFNVLFTNRSSKRVITSLGFAY